MLVNAGGLAHLVEHLLCKQGVNGSSPLASTIHLVRVSNPVENRILWIARIDVQCILFWFLKLEISAVNSLIAISNIDL